jgi:WD40 repeat protein
MKVSSLDFSPDGKLLVVAYMNSIFERGAAQIWRVADGTAAGPPLKHRDGVNSARFSPDGRFVVTASEDFDAIVWNAQTSTPLPVPPFHNNNQVADAAFSDDGRWLITCGSDRSARIWECHSGEALTLPLQHAGVVISARFVSGGRQVLTETKDGRTWLWDLPHEKRTVEELKTLAQLLSGQRASRASESVLQIEEVVWESWQRLHTNVAFTPRQP